MTMQQPTPKNRWEMDGQGDWFARWDFEDWSFIRHSAIGVRISTGLTLAAKTAFLCAVNGR